jgi:hypothetical protein
MTGKSRRGFVLTRKCGKSVNCCKTTILGKDQTMWTTILQHYNVHFHKKTKSANIHYQLVPNITVLKGVATLISIMSTERN